MVLITYTTPVKVQEFLSLGTAFGTGTNPTLETVENIIRRKEDFMDKVTNSSWGVRQTDYEFYDIADIVPARNVGIKIFLGHRNIQTLNAAIGDAFGVWDGSSYVDWISTKTEGRDNDYWIDYNLGILYIMTTISYFGKKRVRIRYRYGGTETEFDGAQLIGAVTLTVDSTTGFEPRGTIRANWLEEITYTGKTATTFTGCVRGVNNTTAAAYSGDEIVQQIPQDIEEACTKLVAMELLQNDDRSAILPEDAPPNYNYTSKIEKWQADVNRILDARKEISS